MAPRFFKIVFMGVGLLILAGVSAYFTLTLIIKGEETVVVPDLAGKEVVSVLQILTDKGLNTKVKGSEYNPDVPENHVIYQEPDAGARIKKDRDVRIIISKGPKSVMVPKLSGFSMQQARIVLDENGLCLGNRSHVFNSRVRKEAIITQTPTAGSTIQRGRCVDVLVSQGTRPASYQIPEFNGRSLEDALMLVEGMNLRVGDLQFVSLKNRPFDIVVEQNPTAGHRIFEGEEVHFKVNKPADEEGSTYLDDRLGVGLFRYRLPHGFLKRHVRIHMNGFGTSLILADEMFTPGEEIWHLISNIPNASVFLYEDGELMQTGIYGDWNRSSPGSGDFQFILSEAPFLSVGKSLE